MATYSFPNFKVQIQDPIITVHQFLDRYDGTGIISMCLQVGEGLDSTKFIVDLAYTYVSELTKAQRLTWALDELVQYEV